MQCTYTKYIMHQCKFYKFSTFSLPQIISLLRFSITLTCLISTVSSLPSAQPVFSMIPLDLSSLPRNYFYLPVLIFLKILFLLIFLILHNNDKIASRWTYSQLTKMGKQKGHIKVCPLTSPHSWLWDGLSCSGHFFSPCPTSGSWRLWLSLQSWVWMFLLERGSLPSQRVMFLRAQLLKSTSAQCLATLMPWVPEKRRFSKEKCCSENGDQHADPLAFKLRELR